MQGICVPLGDFNELHSHLFYFFNQAQDEAYTTCQNLPITKGQQLGENKDN